MLCSLGHIATTRALRASGVTARRIEGAIRDGIIVRLRPGTYACSHLDNETLLVAAAGARIDCISLLARIPDAWSGRGTHGLHVRVRPGQHLGPLPPGTVIHRPRSGEVGVLGALQSAARCLDPTDWLACVESAAHLERLRPQEIERLDAIVGARTRRTLRRRDPRAESGLETHARCRLEDAGFSVVSQVDIPGAGRLDLLVDDRVAVETDGRRWHEHRFLEDRTKDIRVEAWGIRVLRIAPVHVFDEWPHTLATIERMVRESSGSTRPWRIAHG